MERELSNKKVTTKSVVKNEQIETLKRWFRTEYLQELATIERYKILGLKYYKTRFDLEVEAYEKEQLLLQLQNKETLPPYKRNDII